MRSDWDPGHGKKADMQKRYPDISHEEWEYLKRLLDAAGDEASKYDQREYARVVALRHKIERRTGEGER